MEKTGGAGWQTGAPPKTRSLPTTKNWKMILFVCVKLNEIHDQGRKFNWIRPHSCPRCGSDRLWGHGFVMAHFDGFAQGLFLRRFRCPDCSCIIRLRPQGYFKRFQTSVHVIRVCLEQRLLGGKWPLGPSHQRQRHWLSALKRKSVAFFGVFQDLMAGFDRLIKMDQIPICRTV